MSTTTLTFRFRVGGMVTDVTSAVLSDAAAAYGVKRTDTGVVIVAAGTAMTHASTGVYTYSFTDPAPDLTYQWSAEFVYNGLTQHAQFTATGGTSASTSGSISGIGSSSTLTEVQAAYDAAASYAEDNDPAKARAFITACRILIRRMPLEHGTRESHTRTSVEFLQRELTQAIQWLAANGGAGTAGAVAGVSRFDFTNFRS